MRTSINATGGRIIVSAVAGQVILTITDGATSRSIAVEPHVADLIASETLRTATYAERMGAVQAEARQAFGNVIGFPVGAPS